jgi:hypothetical protein
MIHPRSLAAVLVAAVACAATTVSEAGTIISVLGPPEAVAFTIGAGTPVPKIEILGVSWSQTRSYSNVAISVVLNATQSGYTADAYLMQGSLPQPVANQVAHSTLSLIPGGALYTFFSGLTLAAGTYSLVLDSFTAQPDTVGWLYTKSPTIVEDTGATLASALLDSMPNPTSQPSYPPSYPFFISRNSIGYLEYTVVSSVPEPSSFIMVGIAALVGVASWRMRRGMALAG